jgi:mono/diheme cytochrome c family protein
MMVPLHRASILVAVLVWALSAFPAPAFRAEAAQAPAQSTDFNRDVRPILAEACFGCHGPNDGTRQAGLRLDTRDFIGKTVVPGDAAGSLLFQRLAAGDESRRMPPASSGRRLTDAQIDAVRRWIDGGAAWGGDSPGAPAQVAERRVDFDREVRPILSQNCFSCHGPDEQGRQRGLRLDVREGPFATRGQFGGPVIVAGDAAQSLLYRRITAEHERERMPRGRAPLTAAQVSTIRLWIDQGAEWKTHWAFRAPGRPAIPPVVDRRWPRSPIDHFVLARLEQEGLKPSPEADRATLIRRVTFDLTGLPPTLEEIDAFLNDKSPQAYEAVVDRLLASPRYGERMAVEWLDAARYADTNGYQTDGERSMWRWRDWVIDAYNRNMPFDRFTIEQLAGDMLPNATMDQKIATGFNRNHSQNGEGGIVPEEFLVEYAVDRVDTTSTVWLGLTLGCARCHDHKFDPISQKEFYEVLAHFNNIPERGKAFKYVNSPPFVTAPTPHQQAELAKLDEKLHEARAAFSRLEQDAAAAQASWETSTASTPRVDWMLRERLAAHFPLDGDLAGVAAGEPIGVTLEDGVPQFVEGRRGSAAAFDGRRFILGSRGLDIGYDDRFTLAAWIYPTALDGVILSSAVEGDQGELGWRLDLASGKLRINMSTRDLDDGVSAETIEALRVNEWQHVVAGYDGSKQPSGFHLYVNGRAQALKPLLDSVGVRLPQRTALRIGASGSSKPRFQGHIDDVRVYRTLLTAAEAGIVAVPETISEIARLTPQARTPAQSDKLRLCFLDQYAPRPIRQAWRQVVDLERQRQELSDSFPTVMVMQEMTPRRPAFRLIRGAYDNPGERVTPSVPSVLPPLGAHEEKNRLAFARWLVDPAHPLTARVTVNRFWQMYFGAGLVKSPENFGTQGEYPSHPELLDWLATAFIDSGWDVKAMQRAIVTSATYRQSSKVTPALLEKDPENRLLARGARLRLPAQTIRDQALLVAGLLVEKTGGPSVMPYQPAGIWADQGELGLEYRQSKGDDFYRRSLYTFWKRTAGPPAMTMFGASTRETCIVRQNRTNTPLQALNLMNDVTYVEAARRLAERMMTEGGKTPEERVGFAYRLATAKQPTPQAQKILIGGLYRHRERYRADRPAALELVKVGERSRDETLDVAELASYTMVANLILNLDATITKE